MKKLHSAAIAAALCVASAFAHASDADIRKALKAAYPEMPEVALIKPAPLPGLFEVVVGSEMIYSDAKGKYLIQGSLIDVATKKNLTEERMQAINKVDFKDLPLANAVVNKYGTGARKLVVFADPNCGFCKKLERESIPKLKDVTVYTILVPILSPDSGVKSRNIWCAADRGKAWEDWIQREVATPAAAESCDSKVIDANMELARKLRVTGTPTMFFESGTRLPGALPLEEINKHLAAVAR